jgi:hypothetical protein
MKQAQPFEQHYRRELGDGLVVRWSTSADCDKVIDLYWHGFGSSNQEHGFRITADWVRSMFKGHHPLISANDFAVVEHGPSGAIVSGAMLLRQPVVFGGIGISMGRPEMVATLADYRKRGLVRAVFELIHARSEASGDLFQGITGIPYYYRQFGYEYAADLGSRYIIPIDRIPALAEGESEAYRVREAYPADSEQLVAISARESSILRRRKPSEPAVPALVSTPFTAAYVDWQVNYDDGLFPEGFYTVFCILDRDDQIVGSLRLQPTRFDGSITVDALMLAEGVSFAQVLPSLLRALPSKEACVWRSKADMGPVTDICFHITGSHPIYELLHQDLVRSRSQRPYAWYLRVPSLVRFLDTIRPVLEARLAASPLAGHSGELLINCFRDGVRLQFANGNLTAVETWRSDDHDSQPKLEIPPLVFLQLLFGHRSLAQLQEHYPDISLDANIEALVQTLFPALPSSLLALS